MTATTIREIPLDQLVESPFNPRRSFTGIDELAANIKAEGRIHQALLVRPITGADDRFEIVFGHRRFRAAGVAGLATAPCEVRAMSDAEARSAQMSENLKREAMHAFEEAEGYQALIIAHGVTREQIAAQYGMSVSHVTGRLKLLEACPQVRKACEEGKFGAEVALLFARLRTVALQEDALMHIYKQTSDTVENLSYREIKDMLRERYTLQLDNAPFDTTDMLLVPDTPACGPCPKRSGNAPEFADLVDEGKTPRGGWAWRGTGPNLCTDPDCFAAKREHARAAKVAELEAKGKTVLNAKQTAAAFSPYGGLKDTYVPLADVKDQLKKVKTKGAAPQVLTLIDPKTQKPVDVVKRADLAAAGVQNERDKQAAMEAAKRLKTAAAIDAANAGHKRLLRTVHDAMAGQPITLEALRIVARRLLEVSYEYGDGEGELLNEVYGWNEPTYKAPLERLEAMDAGELTRLVVTCCLLDNVLVYRADQKPDALLALATALGIDPDAAMQEPPQTPAGTPEAAAPAAKKPRKAKAAAAEPQAELL